MEMIAERPQKRNRKTLPAIFSFLFVVECLKQINIDLNEQRKKQIYMCALRNNIGNIHVYSFVHAQAKLQPILILRSYDRKKNDIFLRTQHTQNAEKEKRTKKYMKEEHIYNQRQCRFIRRMHSVLHINDKIIKIKKKVGDG